MILDIDAIRKILPHRYPFLLVDAIEEMESKKRVVGIKNVTINEPFFPGHFPSKPVMPGVLIIEALAQTGGVLLLSEVADRDKKLIYLVAVDNVRFRRPVVPGDQLKLELVVVSIRGTFCRMDGKARVNGDVVAEASMMCKMVDLSELEQPQSSPQPAPEPAGAAQK
ncbi:MAG TPA: 3-hydroxyacyl-ACP dehydratase FabZ [Candidatus Acidoferrales bacterium]